MRKQEQGNETENEEKPIKNIQVYHSTQFKEVNNFYFLLF